MLVAVLWMLLAGPVWAEPEPEPIVPGFGPCHSDMPYFCFPHQVFLPEVRGE
jgi:hypothetical protein